jgi:hypothetical protein
MSSHNLFRIARKAHQPQQVKEHDAIDQANLERQNEPTAIDDHEYQNEPTGVADHEFQKEPAMARLSVFQRAPAACEPDSKTAETAV